MSAPRKLAAIFATDVVGYSRLTGLDEEGTLKRLRKRRRELINPAVALHRGRIVKTTAPGQPPFGRPDQDGGASRAALKK